MMRRSLSLIFSLIWAFAIVDCLSECVHFHPEAHSAPVEHHHHGKQQHNHQQSAEHEHIPQHDSSEHCEINTRQILGSKFEPQTSDLLISGLSELIALTGSARIEIASRDLPHSKSYASQRPSIKRGILSLLKSAPNAPPLSI